MTEKCVLEATLSGDYNSLQHILQHNNFYSEQLGKVLCIKEVRENIFMVELLLQHGADVNYKMPDNETLVYYACQKGSISLLKLLLQYGANVENAAYTSPLSEACSNGYASCVQLLLEHGAKIASRYHSSLTNLRGDISAEILKMLIEHGIDLRHGGITLLHNMCEYGNVDAIEMLLKQGVDVHAMNNQQYTPLHTVLLYAPRQAATCLQLLIDHGSNINKDMFEYSKRVRMITPLSFACITGQVECVEVLLRNGDFKNKTVELETVKLPNDKLISPENIVKCIAMVLAGDLKIAVSDKIVNAMLLKLCQFASKETLKQYLQNIDLHQVSCINVLESGNLDWLELVLQLGVIPSVTNSSSQVPLCRAIEIENMDIIKLLIKYNVNVNAYDWNTGDNPLLTAVRHRYITAVELLLEHKADVNLEQRYDNRKYEGKKVTTFGDCEGCSPLSVACWNRDIECIKLLLKHGANPNCSVKSTSLLAIVIGEGANGELVSLLLENGANVNAVDGNNGFGNNTPLSAAVKRNNTDMVMLLLKYGADINPKGIWMGTPLHVAVECNNIEMIRLLLRNGANIDSICKYGRTPLHVAVTGNRVNCLKLLLSHGADVNGSTLGITLPPIIQACNLTYSFDVMEILLANKADVNAVNSSGETSLHLVLNHRNKCHTASLMELLLRHGADVYHLDIKKRSPLHIACKNGNHYQVNTLLKYIPDVNVFTEDIDKETPLMYTIRNPELFQVLLKHGAKLQTSKYYVCNVAGMTSLLDEKNTFLTACMFGDAKVIERSLLHNGGSAVRAHLNSALMLACSNGYVDCVEILLHYRADEGSLIQVNGLNPLYIACDKNHTEIVRLLVRSNRGSTCQLINAQVNGVTPLMIAARRGYDGIVRLLVEAGANQDGARESISPLLIATMSGHEEIVNMLRNGLTQDSKRKIDVVTFDSVKRIMEFNQSSCI